MTEANEVAVGKLMITFADRMKQPGFRRAIHTKKDFLHREVEKVMDAAGYCRVPVVDVLPEGG